MKKNDEETKKRVCLGLLTHPLFFTLDFSQNMMLNTLDFSKNMMLNTLDFSKNVMFNTLDFSIFNI